MPKRTPTFGQSTVHAAFRIGVFLKGLNGLLELIGGALLLWIPPSGIQKAVAALTQQELSEDPRDFIATHLREAVRPLSSNVELFAALYLMAHGVIKVLLVYGLLRSKLWAYPTAIVVFAAFGVYQMYRYVIAPSGWLIALTVLDAGVILLTWAEYRRLRVNRIPEPVGNPDPS
jgi:uncharacterized membrane protein